MLCDVAWVDFVFGCVLCLCVMVHVLVSLCSVGGGVFVCVCVMLLMRACSVYDVVCDVG